jgi:hypothetical protein
MMTWIRWSETRLFKLAHNTDPATGQPQRRMLTVDLMQGIPDRLWPEVLEWSASNMQLQFEVGYRAGRAFCLEHAALCHSTYSEDDQACPLVEQDSCTMTTKRH